MRDMLLKEFNMQSADARDFCKTRTLDEIAAEIKVDRDVAKRICDKYGFFWKRVYRKKDRSVNRDAMIKVLATQFTYEQIGNVFDISRQRVEQIVNG